MERRELSYSVGGNVNWYSHYREQYKGSLKNKKSYHMTLQSHSWAYVRENLNSKDTRSPIFIVVLFTIARIRIQAKCPSIEE